MIKTGTWLPIFPGFYNTIFESDFENEIYHYQNDSDEYQNMTEKEADEFWGSDTYFEANDRYERDVCEKCVELIEDELAYNRTSDNFVSKIEMEKMVSPKEYNFANDSINIIVHFSKENIENIKTFIKDNYDEWTQYLKKRYTSCSGFWSSYDNHPEMEDWCDIEECLEHSHKAGAILRFICNVKQIDTEYLYYGVRDNDSVGEYFDIDAFRNELKEQGFYDDNEMPEKKVPDDPNQLKMF